MTDQSEGSDPLHDHISRDDEKMLLIKQSYALLERIKRVVYRGGLLILAVVIVTGISISLIIGSLSDNVDSNTENINKFGDAVVETRDELRAALKRAQSSSDPNLIKNINDGLEKIDKMCEQTNCEG